VYFGEVMSNIGAAQANIKDYDQGL